MSLLSRPTSRFRLPTSHFRLHSVLLPVALAALILIPRSLLTTAATSETWDEHFHLVRGLALLQGKPAWVYAYWTDPPLGEWLMALPLRLAGATLEGPLGSPYPILSTEEGRHSVLYGQPLSPTALRLMVSAWKSVLFLPAVAVAFCWARRLYGTAAGWLAASLLVFDPTVAAMVPLATPDSMILTAALVACFLGLRWAERPTTRRLVAASAAVAAAMAVKLPGLITPGVVLTIAGAHWLLHRRPATTRLDRAINAGLWRRRVRGVGLACLLVPGFVWAACLFHVGRPDRFGPPFSAEYTEAWSFRGDVLNANLMRPWPAGVYLGATRMGFHRAAWGHPSLLLGDYRNHGWWYYFPVVALFKVPAGTWVVGLLGAASLVRRPDAAGRVVSNRPRRRVGRAAAGERGQHGLPPRAAVLRLSDSPRVTVRRPVDRRRATRPAVAVAGAAAAAGWTALSSLAWHPNYVPYLNHRWLNPFLEITNSNLDWGQSLPQVRAWLDAHPDRPTPTHLVYWGDPGGAAVRYWLGDRVTPVAPGEPIPRRGLLLVSAVELNGTYGERRGLVELWSQRPVAVLAGGAVYAYDLGSITWRPQYRSHPKMGGRLWPIEPGDRGVPAGPRWEPAGSSPSPSGGGTGGTPPG